MSSINTIGGWVDPGSYATVSSGTSNISTSGTLSTPTVVTDAIKINKPKKILMQYELTIVNLNEKNPGVIGVVIGESIEKENCAAPGALRLVLKHYDEIKEMAGLKGIHADKLDTLTYKVKGTNLGVLEDE